MSTDPQDHPPSPSHRRRRASITDLFARPSINTNLNTNVPAQPGQRRMSLTTVGLGIPGTGTSPTQPSPFAIRRRDSVSSVMSSSPTNHGNHNLNNNNTNENAILEDDEELAETPATTPSTSPFARRVSFGGVGGGVARPRSGSGISPSECASTSTATGAAARENTTKSSAVAVPRTSPFQFKRSPSISLSQSYPADSPPAEGFNWPEALRSRAERAPSFSTSPGQGSGMQIPGMHHHPHRGRSASVASMETSAAKRDPIVDMPVQTARVEQQAAPQRRKVNKPDYFQEKILRADFMD